MRTIGALLDGVVAHTSILCTLPGGRFVLLKVALQAALQAAHEGEPLVLPRVEFLCAVDHAVEQALLRPVLADRTLHAVPTIVT